MENVSFADDGSCCQKVRVTEVPENGKANIGLIKLLAKSLKVSKSSIDIIKGHRDRWKTLFLNGDPQELQCRLQEILAS